MIKSIFAEGGLDDDLIMVRGHWNENEIYFTKFYRKEHITLTNFEILSIESDNPHVVNYKGRYDYEARKYKGTWMIPALEMDDQGVLQDIEGGTGAWEM